MSPVGRDVAELSRIEVEARRVIETVVPIDPATTTVVEISAQIDKIDEPPVEAEKVVEVEKVVVVEKPAATATPVATVGPKEKAVVAKKLVEVVVVEKEVLVERVVEKAVESKRLAQFEVAKEVEVEKVVVVEAPRPAEVIVEHPDGDGPPAKERPYGFKNRRQPVHTAHDHLDLRDTSIPHPTP